MTQTAFIVLKTHWHYTDEYYYREGDGGLPVVAYTDKEKATKECEKRNLEKARYSIGEYLPEDGFWEMNNEKHKELSERLQLPGNDDYHHEYRIPKSASDADVLMLLKIMRLEFFVVKEVQVNGL